MVTEGSEDMMEAMIQFSNKRRKDTESDAMAEQRDEKRQRKDVDHKTSSNVSEIENVVTTKGRIAA